ncbi:hypothetical protein [Bradyrhizobium sp. 169]|uniref:hypothetical protein n=1 Tax=Bradyrhizobium sp. 169 TaxID=2782640 RepID=UPI001FF9D8A6|nr:hypothetical protein [Bradyrhizobium sp. 169]MCK1586913.1 hypothetical protein [Bradyrhizobium sp. 169]
MRIVGAFFYVALLAGFFVGRTAANAQLTRPQVLSEPDHAKDIVSNLRAEMSALVAQAGGEARVGLLRAFQLSDSLVNSLAVAYPDSNNVTFGALDKRQQSILQATSNLINEMKGALRDPVNMGPKLGDDFAALISSLVLSTEIPVVTSYGPGFVPPLSMSDTVRVTVTGARFDVASSLRPKLSVGNSEFIPDEITSRSIGFVVPRAVFAGAKFGTSFQRATMTLYRAPSGWRALWLWSNPEVFSYSLIFTTLPEELGTVTSRATIQQTKVDRIKDRLFPILTVTKNGGGGAESTDCFVPEPGYKFDVNSASLIETTHTAYKNNDTSSGTNFGGISYKNDVKTEDRICIRVYAATGCTECGATTAGQLKVDMVRNLETQETLPEVGPIQLNWKGDTQMPLVEKAVSQKITIRLFNEITRTLDISTPYALPFLNIEADAGSKVLLVRPQIDWTAK